MSGGAPQRRGNVSIAAAATSRKTMVNPFIQMPRQLNVQYRQNDPRVSPSQRLTLLTQDLEPPGIFARHRKSFHPSEAALRVVPDWARLGAMPPISIRNRTFFSQDRTYEMESCPKTSSVVYSAEQLQ